MMQKCLFRNIVAVIVVFALRKKTNTPLSVPKEARFPLLVRALVGTLGLIGNFYAIDRLLLANASMLQKMAPFFAILFSAIILREKPKLLQICCVMAAFIGSMFIVKPSIQGVNVAALVGLLGGMMGGLAYTMVRLLTNVHHVKGPTVIFYFSLLSTVVTLVPTLFNYQPMTGKQFFCLLMVGVFATCGQFGVTMAYSFAPAKEVSIFDYSQIIFSAIFGYFVYQQIPDAWSVLGYFTIFAASAIMFFYGRREDSSLKKASAGQ